MFHLGRGRLAAKYILFELIPAFLFAVAGFIFLLTMAQTFKLGEYIIIHRAQVNVIGELLFYIILNTLSMVLPMAMLFSVLMTYGRLSQDSEIVAFKALGLGLRHLLAPTLFLSTLVTILALQLSTKIAPWGSRKADTITNEMRNFKPMTLIQEGVFSEGFFDLVVYANKVDSESGELRNIFIFDERSNTPMTIVAPQGQLITENNGFRSNAYLRLSDGDLHRSSDEFYTKVNFKKFDIHFIDEREVDQSRLDSDAMTMSELKNAIATTKDKKELSKLTLELYRRWTLPCASFVFALIGVGLGTRTNRRTAKGGHIVISISIFMLYWILYASLEGLARRDLDYAVILMWIPNMLFLFAGIYFLQRCNKMD